MSDDSASDNKYEVDYQENPTELFQALEAKEWSYATTEVEGEPSQASIWVVRKADDGEDINWRMLPLHAAVVFHGPAKLIGSIINAYPEGVRTVDDQGMLPIHLAFRYDASGDVVALLLDSYPESVNVKDKKDRLPLELATVQDAPQQPVPKKETPAKKSTLSSRLESLVTCASPKSVSIDELAQPEIKLRTFARTESVEVLSSSASRRAAAMTAYGEALSSIRSTDVRKALEKEQANKMKEQKKSQSAESLKLQGMIEHLTSEARELKNKNKSLEKEIRDMQNAHESATAATNNAKVVPEKKKSSRFGKKK